LRAADPLPAREAKVDVFEAVRVGAPAALEAVLKESPASLKATRGSTGETPLHFAATAGRSEAARVLAEAGADLNARDAGGATPLHAAARARSGATLRVLVEAGADVAACDRLGLTAFDYVLSDWHHYATLDPAVNVPQGMGMDHGQVRENAWRLEAVELLLRRRADLDDAGYLSVLELAAESWSHVLIRLVLEHRGATSLKGPEGRAILATLARSGNEAAARALLAAGADPNVGRDITRRMPLHVACHLDKPDMARFLVEHGADVNRAETEYRFTPLHTAVQWKQVATVRYLVSKGALLDARDKHGRTPADLVRFHPEAYHKPLLSALEPPAR
jgi:ankyrin repeat protein